MDFYYRACEISQINRKYLALHRDVFFFILPTYLLLEDTYHFHFEEGVAVLLLTAKVAVKDRMFALEERTSDATFPCDSKRHVAIILQSLKGLLVFYTQ